MQSSIYYYINKFFSSDTQTSFRRQANERRDHENALLINYDGSIGSQQPKYGGSQLL